MIFLLYVITLQGNAKYNNQIITSSDIKPNMEKSVNF